MDAVSTEYNNEAEQLLSKAVRYPELRSGTKWLPKRSTVSLCVDQARPVTARGVAHTRQHVRVPSTVVSGPWSVCDRLLLGILAIGRRKI